ncbi:MAG TPA: SIR2 family protein [Syntrophorhabdaceae bacterium]|nr:SIR2 family protein [Syntrophorhabdaceae bacterium]
MTENVGPLQIPGQIFPIPELRKKIRDAIANERLIVFIGAGASSIIGCLRWRQLAEHLIELSYKKEKINFWEKERLKNNDPRKIISIMENELSKEDYEKAIEDSLKIDPGRKIKYPIYDHLIKLRGIYITTNIDTCFDPFFEPSRIFINPEQFKRDNLKQNNLFKLHGTITDHKTVIFTIQDYIRHYNRKEVKEFLQYVFNGDFSVLFVGYSLEELEILDYVLLKGDFEKTKSKDVVEEKHFLLLPFYKSEEGLFRFEQSYFKSLGVFTISYAIDEKGYEQLYYVIEKWEKDVNVSTDYLYKGYAFLESNVNDYIESNASEVFQLIRNDIHFRDHFFKRLNTVKWFMPLKQNGYFNSQNAPSPNPVDKEGFYSIPQWNVLPYLEKVSQQVSEPGNEKYIDELLAIIKEVSNYKDSDDKYIDNYRTWWFFVKILINIPPDKIPIDIIELIPIWLNSKFDTLLPGADIVNKLLPKLLSDVSRRENIRKAERIIKYVTKLKRVKTSHGKRFADEDDKFACVIDHYWLEDAFKKHARDIGEKCSEVVVLDLCNKIRKMIKKNIAELSLTVNNRSLLLTLQEKDKASYNLKVFDLGVDDRDKTFEQAFEERARRRRIRKKLIDQYPISASRLHDFVGEAYAVLRGHALLDTYNEEDLKYILYDLYYSLYSRETYWSLYEERRYGRDNAIGVLTLAFKQILLSKANTDNKTTIKILRRLLKEKYMFFPKAALYVIGSTGKVFADCFWEALESESQLIIFDNLACQDELGHVLENIANDLTTEQQEKLRIIIEAGPEYLSSENKEHWIDIWKQERYAALSSNPYFKKLHDVLKQKTGSDARLRPAISDGGTWEGPGPSSLSKDNIFQMTNPRLADYLAEFKETGQWKEPTARGLAEMLKQVVQDKPDKFIDDLKPFLNAGYLYMYYMFWGLKDSWANRKDFDWQKLYNFIKKYLEQDEFWEDELPQVGERGWSPKHETVIGELSELIKTGVRDDNREFYDVFLEDTRHILWLMIDRLSNTPIEEGEYGDYVTHALNSTWGKVIEAFISLTLRIVRENKKKGEEKEIKWDNEYKKQYDALLDKGIIEAFTWLGFYLPQIYYIDKEWATAKVHDLSNKKGERIWEAFMNGYLYGGRVYENIYTLMGPHYEFGIDHFFKESHDRERLVQHISIGYLRGQECIEDTGSLFKKLLDKWDHEQIRGIISYFWMQRDYATTESEDAKKTRQNIIEFWRWIYERYKSKTTEQIDKNDKLLLSDLSKLTIFLEEINDDNFQWLVQVASYVEENFSSPFFIEYLDGLKEKGDKVKTADFIGKIFLKMLERFTPDYDTAHIRSIVDFIYSVEAKEKADKICNIYGSRGYELLRDIYEKYNKQSAL